MANGGFAPMVDPDFDDSWDDIPTQPYTRLDYVNKLLGACEDDTEITAPYIGIQPEESRTVDGSPLRLK